MRLSCWHSFWYNNSSTEKALCGIKVALFPGLHQFRLHKERRGPGIFSHMHDVKGRKVVERIYLNVGALAGLRTARRANVPGNLPHVSS